MKKIGLTHFRLQKKKLKIIALLSLLPLGLLHSLTTKDYWTLILSSCLSLYVPYLWVGLALFLSYKMASGFILRTQTENEKLRFEAVRAIEQNNLQKLQLILDENPEVVHCEYQRRTLEAWCRFYKNVRAREFILGLKTKTNP